MFETRQSPPISERDEMSATKKIDGQDLPASAFAYVGDASNWRTFLLPIHFAGNREKTKNHIRNAMSRFSETKGIPAAQASEVWQRILGAARAHGIDANPRQPFRAKETETAPQASALPGSAHPYTPESTQGEAEAMSALAAERFYERMTAELDEYEEVEWRAATKQKLEELTA